MLSLIADVSLFAASCTFQGGKMEAVVAWPDESLREVEGDIQYLAQNIQGTGLLTVGVGATEFQVPKGADVKMIRRAQLTVLRERFEIDRRSGHDRRQFFRENGHERRSA
jgi:hypothetical protein